MDIEERDPTDLGLSPVPATDVVTDADETRAGPPATAEERARVRRDLGWGTGEVAARLAEPCACGAAPTRWCSRPGRSGGSLGFVHTHRGTS